MLVTNLSQTVGKTLWAKGMTREQLCGVMGVLPSSLSRMLHNDVMSRQLMDGLDAIGVDVEIVLHIREVDSDE